MGKKKAKGKDPLYDLEVQYTGIIPYTEVDRRDIYYSALVKDIVKNNRTSQTLKVVFFFVVCCIFVYTCVKGMLVISNISNKKDISYSDIAVALTGFGSVLSSIIVLPKIVAKHLFPKNSEKVRFNFIRDNQKFDQPLNDGINSGKAEKIDELIDNILGNDSVRADEQDNAREPKGKVSEKGKRKKWFLLKKR